MKKIAAMIVGPTAGGKTEYAIRLAEHFSGEIVSADSMQVYRELNIGSAKPTAAQLKRVPHHLVDFVDPRHPFSAADYQDLARECLQRLFERETLPVICGGTGLYINALLYDFDFSGEAGSRAYREELFARVGNNDPLTLHEHLKRLQPEAAEQIHPHNVKRVLRAIERIELKKGGALSSFRDAAKRVTEQFQPVLFGLKRDRSALISRIDRRVDGMIEQGLVDEVAGLLQSGVSPASNSMKGIGYKELVPHVLEGQPLAECIERIKIHTRQYAKRQMTWFRRIDGIEWIDLHDDKIEDTALDYMIGRISENR